MIYPVAIMIVSAKIPWQKDPNRMLDLPAGFRYQIVSRSGKEMRDRSITANKIDGC